jgi:hypothetical protein
MRERGNNKGDGGLPPTLDPARIRREISNLIEYLTV